MVGTVVGTGGWQLANVPGCRRHVNGSDSLAHSAILRGGTMRDAAVARLAAHRRMSWDMSGQKGKEREGVWHAGMFYSRRELVEQDRNSLKHAVKYSRGTRGTDPPQIVEDGGGEFRYVTLAVFRGDGRRREEYATPAAISVRANNGPSRVSVSVDSRPERAA